MFALTAAFFALMSLGSEAADPLTDVVPVCSEGLTESQTALQSATTARVLRRARVAVSSHLFRRGHLAGCARMRFVIDANGRAQQIVIERFHPDETFAREARRLLVSMEFSAGTGGHEEARMIIALSMQDTPVDSTTADEMR